MKKTKRLQNSIGYTFKSDELLDLALSHRSVGKDNNERLEFLGDSLLSLIITEALYNKFELAREGELSSLRSSFVKGETLAELAREFGIGDYLNLGEGELKSGGFRRASILADAVEAIIGAIYLDSDIETCRRCVLAWYEPRLASVELTANVKDAKTRLQEYLQERKSPLPSYRVVETLGESHAREFVVECSINNGERKGVAKSSSKRMAEKLAAEKVLESLLPKGDQ